MPVKFGLTQASYSFGRGNENIGNTILRIARMAEGCGFDSILLSDHFMQYARIGPPTEPVLESWTTLGALASVTKRIKIGTLVSCNSFRYPSHLAKIAATLDVLSNGRLILGIGAGSLESEHIAYGIPLFKLSERTRRLEESVEIILKLWTQRKVTYRGRFFQLREAVCNPKPLQKPHPPIIIGGNGRRILRLVAKYGLACNVTGGVRLVKLHLAQLKESCKENATKYSHTLKTTRINVVIGEDRRSVDRKIAGYKPTGMPLDRYLFNSIAGTPEKITSDLQDLANLGLDQIYVALPDADDPRTLRMLSKDVFPNVQ